METVTLTTESIGCHLDNCRGHYITRDTIELAIEYGFIVGGFEKFALDAYDNYSIGSLSDSMIEYPHEELHDLCDMAVQWLNSGQDKCECVEGSHGEGWPGPGSEWQNSSYRSGKLYTPGAWVICRKCSGSGRGPREPGQNFPPIVPHGAVWMFNDGDFGLYLDDENEEL